MPRTHDTTDSFDYVIVGAGAAGSILANRLTEDGRTTVCVLEAGPRDWHPFLHIPAGFIKVLFDPAFTWQFSSEPTANTSGRRIPIPQGRTLGGSTSINGLAYNRGQPSDFDEWAASGNPGWGYEDVLPYFKRTERKIGACDEAFRGRSGEQAVTDMDWVHPICEAFIAGAVGQGMPRNPDYNGTSQEGVGYYQRTIMNGWRQSTARSFLRPAKKRRNLELRTRAQATAILFEGKRATGVRYACGPSRDTPCEVRARREVIVCGGAINTPKLLQISGVGPAAHLQSIGVPVVHELPGIGENLRDHFSVRMVAKVKDCLTMNELARGARLGGQIARWMVGLPNILALSPSLVHWFWKSREGLNAPDIQGVFTPASYREGYIGVLDDYPGMTCGVWQHRPQSTGYVRARSSDPFEHPVVQPNYLEDPYDREVLLGGMRVARRLLRSSELARFFDAETMPGDGVVGDDELLDYARRFGVSSYHVMGTARMGPARDATTVVDDQLRVHGIERLRIVDASVMPNMPSANTCASTMMIAEKAADMIRGLQPLSPGGSARAAA
ncbi:GMC family oxidoreductase [Methylobacterium sp. ID0610]|uniref:GMC family oxidoreductase n=1 Tax=Methylobacterium carpenticola TaxID=3344827 RepID=UPI0036740CEF